MNTFLIGSGAVDGAWTPVVNAVKSCGIEKANSNNINGIFSRVIYRIRRFHDMKHINISELDNSVYNDDIKFLSDVKYKIKNNLIHAHRNGEIFCRDIVDIAFKKHAKNQHNYVITTNWDKSIESFLSKYNTTGTPFYVHGSVDGDIYTPAETGLDPHKTPHESTEQELKHAKFLNILAKETTHLIIIGCALNDLDPELIDLVATGIGNNTILKSITIYDKDQTSANQVKDKLDILIHESKVINIYTPIH